MTEQEWINIFADNLRDILKEYGYTQDEFADSINATRSTINRYLNKQQMPSLKNAINMSLELGISMDELFIFDSRVN